MTDPAAPGVTQPLDLDGLQEKALAEARELATFHESVLISQQTLQTLLALIEAARPGEAWAAALTPELVGRVLSDCGWGPLMPRNADSVIVIAESLRRALGRSHD